MSHLLLQLENPVHERLTRWWASRHINIHWNDSVASSCHTVTVVVVSSTVGARTHGDNPSRLYNVSLIGHRDVSSCVYLRHLIVNLSQSRCHLVGESTSNNHDVGLTWRSTENNSHTVLVVTWGRKMHHFDSAAGETESHGPKGGLTSPVGNLIEGGASGVLVVDLLQ
jgi:hypothetical protein